MHFTLNSGSTPKKPQKKKWIGRHPVLFPISLFILFAFGLFAIQSATQDPVIGIIVIDGIILESEPTVRKLRSLENDVNVKGIVVRINSPGGAVAPSQEIFAELLRIGEKMPIYSSISSVAASGGYYVAIGTQKIYANPGSLTGSIGVVMHTYNVKNLMDKIGIFTETIKSGKNKDIGSAFRKMTKEERQLLKGVIDDTHTQFVRAVAEYRPFDIKKAELLADGTIFTGQQALEKGLIDGLLSFRQTVEQLKQDVGLNEEIHLLYPEDEKDSFFEGLDLIESVLSIPQKTIRSGLFYLDGNL